MKTNGYMQFSVVERKNKLWVLVIMGGLESQYQSGIPDSVKWDVPYFPSLISLLK